MSTPKSKMEQIKALENGRGLQYLLNEAYAILGNPISLFDIYYNLLSYTEGVVTDDPLWIELTANKSFSQETMDFFKEEGFIETVANHGAVAFLHSDKLKYDRFNGTIFDENYTRMANINVTLCKKPVEDGDAELIEEICKILLKEIRKSAYYRNLDLAYQESLMSLLISGEPIDKGSETLIKLADIYKKMATYLYLAAADISRCRGGLHQLTYFRDLFKQMQPDFFYSIYSDHIIIIMSSDDEECGAAEALSGFNNLFEQNNLYAGISSRFENLFESRKYYIEAVEAINHGLKTDSAQRIFQYE